MGSLCLLLSRCCICLWGMYNLLTTSTLYFIMHREISLCSAICNFFFLCWCPLFIVFSLSKLVAVNLVSLCYLCTALGKVDILSSCILVFCYFFCSSAHCWKCCLKFLYLVWQLVFGRKMITIHILLSRYRYVY
jgi:hypothetical protein